MITQVAMPQMGLEVTEGTVVALHVAVGAPVAEGDPLVEVETDKAITDVVAPCAGVVVAMAVDVGDTVPVGEALLSLGEAPGDAPPPVNGRLRAAPVARRAADKLGIVLASVTGTGPRGRITLGDVERAAQTEQAAAPETPAAPAPAPTSAPAAVPDPGGRVEPMSPTRKAIARRMSASQRIPQFALDREIDATWLLAEKARIEAQSPVKVSVNDLLVQALAAALVAHPDVAASYVEPGEPGGAPGLRRREGVDVGLAVAGDRGLLVPVLRDAHTQTLGELALQRARLVAAARDGTLGLADMTGATVSLSSLASFGVDRFDAMLNPGETAILAIGRVVERAVPRDRGIAIAPMMAMTLTLDHRVADGATGAAALSHLADLLEGAMAWRI